MPNMISDHLGTRGGFHSSSPFSCLLYKKHLVWEAGRLGMVQPTATPTPQQCLHSHAAQHHAMASHAFSAPTSHKPREGSPITMGGATVESCKGSLLGEQGVWRGGLWGNNQDATQAACRVHYPSPTPGSALNPSFLLTHILEDSGLHLQQLQHCYPHGALGRARGSLLGLSWLS